jgi:hypothetical protein
MWSSGSLDDTYGAVMWWKLIQSTLWYANHCSKGCHVSSNSSSSDSVILDDDACDRLHMCVRQIMIMYASAYNRTLQSSMDLWQALQKQQTKQQRQQQCIQEHSVILCYNSYVALIRPCTCMQLLVCTRVYSAAYICINVATTASMICSTVAAALVAWATEAQTAQHQS